MSLPGIGVVLAIGTALAGVLYLLYQQSNTQNQYSYGSYNSENVYREPPRIASSNPSSERPSGRKRRNNLCSICLDKTEKDMRTLDCNHSFHKRCIDTWLLQQNTCPNCRKVI